MNIVGDNVIFDSLGNVFRGKVEKELAMTKLDEDVVEISGKVKKSGVYKVNEGDTLSELIEKAGGILNKRPFKGALLGMLYGSFVSKDGVDTPLDFNLFGEDGVKSIIVLSDEDCIVQFLKFYVEYISGVIKDGSYKELIPLKDEISKSWSILDRISKGKANMRDVYILRNISCNILEEINIKKSNIVEAIDIYYDEIEQHIEDKKCITGQCPQLAKLRITDKCVGCGACKRTCPVDCIDGSLKVKHFINTEKCTHCGQCIQACPVDAITAGDNTFKFLRDLVTPHRIVVTQIAPAVRVAIGEEFGFEPGENVEKKIVAALKKIGVDYVFDTSWAADLTIMEEAAELQERLEAYFKGDKNVKLPLLTSCCPSWVKFIEQYYPEMVDVPSSAKSPMQMFATVCKDIWAKEKGFDRNMVTSVAIMPCVAKKYEAAREEFSREDNYDTDYVITTRELIKIFKENNIDLKEIDDIEFDSPLAEYSGAGVIFGRTGGVIEAATRTAIENMTGKRIENIEFESLRGWDGFRSCDLEVGDIKLRIGVAHGLKEAGKMLDKIRSGEEFYHAIEIMACQGGCVGGGGQPKAKKRQEVIVKRGEGLNAIDRSLPIRRSHENPSVKLIYDKYLEKPLSKKAHELLHTRYFPKI